MATRIPILIAMIFLGGCSGSRPPVNSQRPLPEYLAIASTEPSSRHAGEVLAEFAVDHWGEHLLIPVMRGGKPACFVLDTGSSLSVMDSTAFSNLTPLGSSVVMQTGNGPSKIGLFYPPDLHIGPMSLADSGWVAMGDLSDFSSVLDRPVIGILGAPVLRNLVLQIDLDEHQVRLLSTDNQPYSAWGPAVAMRLDGHGRPSIHGSLAGVDQDFMIDTGSPTCITVPSKGFDEMMKPRKEKFVVLPTGTANGVANLRYARAPEFVVGGIHYHDMICAEDKDDIGSVGLEFLERHLVTIDFPGQRLYLQPSHEFDRRSQADMCGIGLHRKGGQLVVLWVRPEGPAYMAGIRSGDVITAINSKPAAEYGLADLRELIPSGEGRELTITFRRGELQKTVTLKLRSAI